MERAELVGLHGGDDEPGERVHRRGAGKLVRGHGHRFALGACQQRAAEQVVGAGGVDPAGAHDDVVLVQLVDEALAGLFGLAVHVRRVRGVELIERVVGVLGEQVVGGQVHHGGADVVAGDGQVARAKGVDLVGLVGVLVGLGAAGQCRAVDDEVGAVRFGEVQHFVQVRHVDLDVAGHDLIAAVVQEMLDCLAHSPRRAGDPHGVLRTHFHRAPPSGCAARGACGRSVAQGVSG